MTSPFSRGERIETSTTLADRVRELSRVPFLRYALVGLASNAVLYALYLAMTWVGIGHKVAMTLVFVVGIVQTFGFNRSWTFRSASPSGPALLRYSCVYAFGYLISWLGMWVFVDRLGYPHQLVQLALIVIVAVFIFLNLKFWVFGKLRVAPLRAASP